MCIHSPIQHILARLTEQTTSERIDTMSNAAQETSGYYNVPRIGDTWSSHLVEISISGIYAEGESQEEAIRNWMCVAQNQIDAQNASALLHSQDRIHADDMKAACKTILNHRGPAPHPDHRMAEQLLDVLERCA